GKRSLASGEPVTVDTPFAIGSITKQFTCAGVLLLAEDGKLGLDDPIARYRPELTRAGDITLFDVLSHVSGYPDYYPLDFIDEPKSRPIDIDDLIRRYAAGPLDFEPRTRWSYSNTGYLIAGRIIEELAGEDLNSFMQRRLFVPAGMQHAVLDPPPGTPELATGHTSFLLGEPTAAVPEGKGWLHAAGGIYATATDLARWDLALMPNQLLRPESWRAMITPRPLVDGEPTDYACGVAVSRLQGETVIAHKGAVSGFLAYNAMIPRTRSAVILLSNAEYADATGLYNELLSFLIEADRPRPSVAGDLPRETALALFRQLQAGAVDRDRLGDAYARLLTDDKLKQIAPRLRALGEPGAVVLERLGERGGMEVAVLKFMFESTTLRALLYRTPDGKVQQFLLTRL
ncbi:MAG TPA: serine hydrolase domain-containing protein, partial [Nannocystis sp.]